MTLKDRIKRIEIVVKKLLQEIKNSQNWWDQLHLMEEIEPTKKISSKNCKNMRAWKHKDTSGKSELKKNTSKQGTVNIER